ncbi:organic solvent tolerance protein [Roseivivax halodurans JCM 10272]|uniref:LPS-assembly protein LptD n=1 Tax=Roseivivax halodurans JCM 10272 TaxID=1449350 RepID=X7EHP1_9RHOB|nr:LPS assembly protein LptD [Roseivivax halodurans]ETX14663.1 organic solvent tolerance protein [Roseivivax halodurans JCM 10272]
MKRLVLALALLWTGPLSAQTEQAQAPALLVADSVTVENRSRLIATGNVEALHDGTRLRAERIVYDQATGALRIDGPIRITDPDGTILVADTAELDEDFENGLLRGARLVLDEQLQLASVEARRVDGRYTSLNRVAVTSCQVCGPGQVPLWQIRASRVVHDEVEQQIYFDNAQFRVLDVPLVYFPRLRVPDPTLERARGFLTPSVRSSTLLGFGIKTPYFVPLGRHQDLTFTPYLSPVTRTLETRYRRAFAYGDIEVNTAVSQDTLVSKETRAYLFAQGSFELPRRFTLDFDIETTTDEAYLNDYDYSGKDRLDSAITLSRATPLSFFSAELVHYQTLRDSERDSTQPTIVLHSEYERRFPDLWGGELRLGTVSQGHYRYSDLDTDSTDPDDIVDGRDVARITAEASWRRRWTLTGGVRAGVTTQAWADQFWIAQDATSDEKASQLTPAVAVELRWPWTRSGGDGSHSLIEPILQTAWIGGDRPDIANDESTRVEFDEGNLLALSRFPAADRRERGRVSAAGLRYTHEDPSGWSGGLTFGRLWRENADPSFTPSSGLDEENSDILVAGYLANREGLALTARGLLDETEGSFTKAEARLDWQTMTFGLGASYLLVRADAAEDRGGQTSEWSLDGAYDIDDTWSTAAFGRYDLSGNRFARAGLGVVYENECVSANFTVERRFASSTTLEPSTDFGLTVALKGFSTGGSAKEYRRTCS